MADIGNEITTNLFKVALKRHVEKQHHDQAVIHPPDANPEFHGDTAVRGMHQSAGRVAPGNHFANIINTENVHYRLAGKPFAKEAHGGAVGRQDNA